MNIEQLLKDREFEVRQLLRRYRVLGEPTIETINRAHKLHGAEFMTKLMGIVSAEDSFTGVGAIVQNELFNQQVAAASQQKQTGKFWTFWDNLLNTVGKTGATIGQFKYDALGQPMQDQYYYEAQQSRQKTVFVIAGILVVIILAILLIRKK